MTLKKFISQLSFNDTKPHYCSALCTADDNIGETIDVLRNDLASRNIHLDCAFSLIMPESYVSLPFMDVDTPENEKRKKDKAADDLERFTRLIIEKQKNIEELTIGRWPKINSLDYRRIFHQTHDNRQAVSYNYGKVYWLEKYNMKSRFLTLINVRLEIIVYLRNKHRTLLLSSIFSFSEYCRSNTHHSAVAFNGYFIIAAHTP